MSNARKLISAEMLAARCAKSEDFKVGYNSFVTNKAFDYNATAYYERGRAFAIYTSAVKAPKAVWREGKLAKTATERLINAVYAGYVR